MDEPHYGAITAYRFGVLGPAASKYEHRAPVTKGAVLRCYGWLGGGRCWHSYLSSLCSPQPFAFAPGWVKQRRPHDISPRNHAPDPWEEYQWWDSNPSDVYPTLLRCRLCNLDWLEPSTGFEPAPSALRKRRTASYASMAGSSDGSRTHTNTVLSRVPLPIGLRSLVRLTGLEPAISCM